jgi:hypothetical protein
MARFLLLSSMKQIVTGKWQRQPKRESTGC